MENDLQPEVFENAFSGLWWAISTVTTVGYGDIYPITGIGKILGAFIAILGVGLIAVPTSILSAGFIEQVSEKNTRKRRKKMISNINSYNSKIRRYISHKRK